MEIIEAVWYNFLFPQKKRGDYRLIQSLIAQASWIILFPIISCSWNESLFYETQLN